MQFIVALIVACLIFAFCFAVFLLKGRKGDMEPRLHTCGQGDDCHCRKEEDQPAMCAQHEDCPHHGQDPSDTPFDLLEILEKARNNDHSA